MRDLPEDGLSTRDMFLIPPTFLSALVSIALLPELAQPVQRTRFLIWLAVFVACICFVQAKRAFLIGILLFIGIRIVWSLTLTGLKS